MELEYALTLPGFVAGLKAALEQLRASPRDAALLLTDEQLLFEVYRRAGPPCRCGGTHVCQPASPA